MNILKKPEFSHQSVFNACLSGLLDQTLVARFTGTWDALYQSEVSYVRLATAGQLHECASHARGGDDQLSTGPVTRGELKSLYSRQMARRGRPAREFYDVIRNSVPNNICPYCGIGAVETLDHFLPKSRFSSLSILPLNLVPACRDCNTGKSDVLGPDDAVMCHPYFEGVAVTTDEWLCAEVVDDLAVRIEYDVIAPRHWSPEMAKRVENHFLQLDLKRRFSIQAASRLTYYAGMIKILVNDGLEPSVSRFIQSAASAEASAYGVNSWQSGLARALLASEWFCTTGYLQLTE